MSHGYSAPHGRRTVDTADIEIFLTLAEELHFGRTAERLHLTQPRVTRVIAALEGHAGGKLFERTSRKVRLTPLGARLRAGLQPAYTEIIAAFADARQAASDKTGELRIGVTVTTQGEALTRLASAFEANHRGCRAVLSQVDLIRPYEALRNGEVDVLVNWLALDEPDLTVGPVIDCRERVLAVGRAHPLAKRRTVDAEELADYENTGFIQSPFPRALLDAIMPPRTPSGRPVRRTNARGVYEMLDEIARGTAVHPTMADIVLSRRDDIVLIPIDGLPPLPLGLIWCTGHENARIRALADTAGGSAPGTGRRGWQRDKDPDVTPLCLAQVCDLAQPGSRCNRWLSRGRARTMSGGRLEDVVDLLVEEVVAAADAVAVDGEQDRDAMSGPGGDLGEVPSGVQPQ